MPVCLLLFLNLFSAALLLKSRFRSAIKKNLKNTRRIVISHIQYHFQTSDKTLIWGLLSPLRTQTSSDADDWLSRPNKTSSLTNKQRIKKKTVLIFSFLNLSTFSKLPTSALPPSYIQSEAAYLCDLMTAGIVLNTVSTQQRGCLYCRRGLKEVSVSDLLCLKTLSCCRWVIAGVHCNFGGSKLYSCNFRGTFQSYSLRVFLYPSQTFQCQRLVEYERGRNKKLNAILQERQTDQRKHSRKPKKGRARRYQMILTFTGAKRHDWCWSLTSNLQISQIQWLIERRLTDTLSSLHPSLFSWCRKAVTPPAVLPSYILPLPSTALLIFSWLMSPLRYFSVISTWMYFPPAGAVCEKCQQEKTGRRGCVALYHANTMLMVLCKRLICCQLKAIRKQFSLTLWV